MTDEQKIAIEQEQSQTGLNSAEREQVRAERKQQTRDRIGLRIMALRKMAGLTQEQLSERAGLQRSHIAKIERGKYAVTFETIQAIAEALDMTVDIIDPKLADLAQLKTLTKE